MPRFADLYGLRGAVVAAVDLVRGIGRFAGLDVIDVPGATGDLDTDYGAKARAAIDALRDHDLVWVHVEAPDEAAHMGSRPEKIDGDRARRPRGPGADRRGSLAAGRPRAARSPDAAAHPHPRRRRRCRSCSPAATARRSPRRSPAPAFSELEAERTDVLVDDGPSLMRQFLAATG